MVKKKKKTSTCVTTIAQKPNAKNANAKRQLLNCFLKGKKIAHLGKNGYFTSNSNLSPFTEILAFIACLSNSFSSGHIFNSILQN